MVNYLLESCPEAMAACNCGIVASTKGKPSTAEAALSKSDVRPPVKSIAPPAAVVPKKLLRVMLRLVASKLRVFISRPPFSTAKDFEQIKLEPFLRFLGWTFGVWCSANESRREFAQLSFQETSWRTSSNRRASMARGPGGLCLSIWEAEVALIFAPYRNPRESRSTAYS